MIGTGKMGRCLATILKDRAEVTVCSRSEDRARSLAMRSGVGWAGIDAISASDVVIAAIPSEILPSFAEDAAALMRPGTLFVDVSSVKLGFIEEVQRKLPECFGYISIHPLFTSPRIKEKDMAVINVRRSPIGEKFTSLLSDSGIRVFETTPEEHDRATAITQVLHHFALLSFEKALKDLSDDCELEVEKFWTHSLKKTLAVLRLINRNHETILMIQRRNRFGREIREEFVRNAERLNQEFSR